MSRVAQQALLGSAAPPAATSAYVGLTTLSGTAAAQSVAAVPIGAAAFNRRVFQLVHWYNPSSAKALSSATIGGVAASVHGQATGSAASSLFAGVALISAPLTVGTTADVTLNFASGAAYYHPFLETFRVTGLLSATAGDTASASPSLAPSYSGAIDVQDDGVLMVGATLHGPGSDYSLVGATENYESSIYSGERIIGGSLAVTATEINRVIEVHTNGSNLSGPIIAAAFR